jgi:hypothetical protein
MKTILKISIIVIVILCGNIVFADTTLMSGYFMQNVPFLSPQMIVYMDTGILMQGVVRFSLIAKWIVWPVISFFMFLYWMFVYKVYQEKLDPKYVGIALFKFVIVLFILINWEPIYKLLLDLFAYIHYFIAKIDIIGMEIGGVSTQYSTDMNYILSNLSWDWDIGNNKIGNLWDLATIGIDALVGLLLNIIVFLFYLFFQVVVSLTEIILIVGRAWIIIAYGGLGYIGVVLMLLPWANKFSIRIFQFIIGVFTWPIFMTIGTKILMILVWMNINFMHKITGTSVTQTDQAMEFMRGLLGSDVWVKIAILALWAGWNIAVPVISSKFNIQGMVSVASGLATAATMTAITGAATAGGAILPLITKMNPQINQMATNLSGIKSALQNGANIGKKTQGITGKHLPKINIREED